MNVRPIAERSPAWLAAVAAAAALAGFWPILRNGYTYDDITAIADNVMVPALVRPSVYFSHKYFFVSCETTYRPLVSLSYGLEWLFWGRSALGSHAVNLVLHVAVSALIVPVCLSLGASRTVALTAGVLYALHPLGAEATCSVGYREDLLCALFYLPAFTLWRPLAVSRGVAGGAERDAIRRIARPHNPADCATPLAAGRLGPQKGDPRGSPPPGTSSGHGTPTRSNRPLRLVLAAALYVPALLSKEMALSFPLLVLASDLRGWAPRSTEWRAAAWRRLPWHALLWAMTGGALALYFGFTGGDAGFELPNPAPLAARAAAFLLVVVRYLRLFVWPHPLLLNHVVSLGAPGVWVQGALGLVVLAALAVLAWRWRKSFPPGWESLVAFVILLGPVSNLVPLYHPMAERYLALPMVALCYLAAAALARVPNGWMRRGVICTLLVACVLLSWQRCGEWRSQRTLWEAELRRGTPSAEAYGSIGGELMELGQYAQALPYLQRAEALAPGVVVSQSNLGGDYALLGQNDKARQYLQRAFAIQQNHALSHAYLAIVLASEGRREQSLAECATALRDGGALVSVHNAAGTAYYLLDDKDRALEEFRLVAETNPVFVRSLLALAGILEDGAEYEEAADACRDVLRVDPANAEALERLRRVSGRERGAALRSARSLPSGDKGPGASAAP